MQSSFKKVPELGDVPLVMDLTKDKEKLQILKLILAAQEMARPFAAPPGIPADRKAALVAAFDATMKDPEYLAEAKKLNIDVNPVSGKATRRAAGRALRHAEGRGEEGQRGDHEVNGPRASHKPACHHPPKRVTRVDVHERGIVPLRCGALDAPPSRGMTPRSWPCLRIEQPPHQPPLIGSRITRLEDEPLLRGRGRFVDDIALPGVWHAAFVRSPHPHALIKGVDKSAALALPGRARGADAGRPRARSWSSAG